MMLTYMAAYNLQAIDIVKIDLADQEALEAECTEGFELGYSGKQIIHPSQLEIANKCFSPNPVQVTWSKRVVEAADAHYETGTGAFSLDDKMIDEPTVKQARKLLERAQVCGM